MVVCFNGGMFQMRDNMAEHLQPIKRLLGVPLLGPDEFKKLKDSSTCQTSGQGLSTFNESWAHAQFISSHTDEGFRTKFLAQASKLNRLAMAVIHISGGPSPRGTAEAVTRLLNSQTLQMRNVVVSGPTIGVANGYVHDKGCDS